MKQIAGAHYLDMKLQPWEIIEACDLDFFEGNALKYLLRYKRKGRPKEDLEKLKHYVEKLIARHEAQEYQRGIEEVYKEDYAKIQPGKMYEVDNNGRPVYHKTPSSLWKKAHDTIPGEDLSEYRPVDGNEKFDANAG